MQNSRFSWIIFFFISKKKKKKTITELFPFQLNISDVLTQGYTICYSMLFMCGKLIICSYGWTVNTEYCFKTLVKLIKNRISIPLCKLLKLARFFFFFFILVPHFYEYSLENIHLWIINTWNYANKICKGANKTDIIFGYMILIFTIKVLKHFFSYHFLFLVSWHFRWKL